MRPKLAQLRRLLQVVADYERLSAVLVSTLQHDYPCRASRDRYGQPDRQAAVPLWPYQVRSRHAPDLADWVVRLQRPFAPTQARPSHRA
jgi:hypothetical protein